jgi:hypothetical protein
MVRCETFQVCGQAIPFGHIRGATARGCPTFGKNWKALTLKVGPSKDRRLQVYCSSMRRPGTER